MAAANALANASKTVQSQASALARSAASKATKKARGGTKVKSTMLGGGAALVLGVLERFAPEAQLGPIDNGLTVGVPLVIAGAVMSSKTGDYLLMLGNGPLFAGIRQTAKLIGADEADATTEGEFDDVGGEFDNL
jgi:hypothetical protein